MKQTTTIRLDKDEIQQALTNYCQTKLSLNNIYTTEIKFTVKFTELTEAEIIFSHSEYGLSRTPEEQQEDEEMGYKPNSEEYYEDGTPRWPPPKEDKQTETEENKKEYHPWYP